MLMCKEAEEPSPPTPRRAFALRRKETMKHIIKFTETPKNCKACKNWNAKNRQCKLKECEYTAFKAHHGGGC